MVFILLFYYYNPNNITTITPIYFKQKYKYNLIYRIFRKMYY